MSLREALYRKALGIPEPRVNGHWIYLDGGTLDLGIVRDSQLTSANDYQIFDEAFEGQPFFSGSSCTGGDSA